jgi:hypothetical protein
MCNPIECPICYEEITNVNCVTTECSHTFHASCLFKNMNNSVDCPLCRKELVEVPDFEEDDEDDDYEESISDSDSDDEEDDDEDNVNNNENQNKKKKVTITQIMVELKKQNVDERKLMTTLLEVYFDKRYLKTKLEYKDNDEDEDLSEKIINSIEDVILGNISVDQRDNRSYADVLRGEQAKRERGIGPNIVNL